MKNRCEYCDEIKGSKESTFHKIYNLETRIIYEDNAFIVMPTIGQLFQYSLLIIPKKHIELLSELDEDELIQLKEIFAIFKDKLSKFGNVVAFEHGAKRYTKGGCGIYHAHLHVIPLPKKISLFDFLKHKFTKQSNIYESLKSLNCSSEYLMVINSDGSCAVLDIEQYSKEYPSQFFRRELQKYFKLNKSWDWKEYSEPEEWLISSVKELS